MTRCARSLKILSCTTALLGLAFAATAHDVVPDAIRKCAGIGEAAARLECYDRAVATGTTVPAAGASEAAVPPPDVTRNAAPTGAPAATAGAAAVLSPEEKFGVTGELKRAKEPKPEEPALEQLVGKVKALRKAPSGEYVVTLENGQVWRQLTAATMMIKPGDQVTIKPRSMGSYWMTDPTGRGSRVKRIQ